MSALVIPITCSSGCGSRLGTWTPRPGILPGRVFETPRYGLRFDLKPAREDHFTIDRLVFLATDDVAELLSAIFCASCWGKKGPDEAAQVAASLAELELDRRRRAALALRSRLKAVREPSRATRRLRVSMQPASLPSHA